MAGSVPRGARRLVPAGVPRRGEVIAASAVIAVIAHLLLAQLTLVLAVAFALTARFTRWRLWWLLGPAAAGLAMTVAVGSGHAMAGFAAGPVHVLGYLVRGHLADRLSHPLDAFGPAASWLPVQLPIALIAGSAEAAVLSWLGWRHAGERVPPRPGVIAAARGALAARMIRAGAVVTRQGCALGVVTATGGIAELRWPQVERGALVVGASALEATVTSLQVVHAALRRRKPLVVIDAGADVALADALDAACLATGTPLLLPGIDLDLGTVIGSVIGGRTAALIAAGSPEHAIKACGDIAALAAHLRQIGVNGDGLVWVPGGERLPAQSLAALISAVGGAGLSVLITTTSPAAATELAALVAVLLIHKIADQALADALATRTGMRLPPARTLLSLRPAEFVLAVSTPEHWSAELGRLVSARLPAALLAPARLPARRWRS